LYEGELMNVRTVASLIKGGRLLLLLRFKMLFTSFYRLCFFASMADSVILKQLSRGPVPLDNLTGAFVKDPSLRNATEAWLGLGVRLGLLKKNDEGYSLRGFLANKLAAPENDSIRALVREVASLHHLFIMQTPGKLEQGHVWDPAYQHSEYGDLIARSSRTLEPFLFELIDRIFPKSGPVRLLEVGCGHAGYIIHAADRDSSLNAVGLELDSQVAEIARCNIRTRGLQDRVKIVVEDVRGYRPPDLFEILTLYNNIYYFPVEERIALFRHLRSLIKPNGRILLTTGCMNGSIEFELVNLIHSATKGWGRLPDKNEMLQQLSEAGFERNSAISLVPGNKYYAFIGYRPA
jgi:4-hydroxy-2,2'-bipyrrole-5-carbaldehyde O-methyltransferase